MPLPTHALAQGGEKEHRASNSHQSRHDGQPRHQGIGPLCPRATACHGGQQGQRQATGNGQGKRRQRISPTKAQTKKRGGRRCLVHGCGGYSMKKAVVLDFRALEAINVPASHRESDATRQK